MMKQTGLLGLLTGSLMVASVQAESTFCFLVGYWQGEHNGVVTEEIWLPAQYDALHAINRSYPLTPKLDTGGQPKKPAFEFLRIEKHGNVWQYLAQPSGKPATTFVLKDHSKQHAVFENRQHDFPQRIRYQLDADQALQVTADTLDGNGPMLQWRWQRKAGSPICE